MQIFTLNKNTQNQFNEMINDNENPMPEKDVKALKTAVARYSKQNTIGKKIAYVAMRVWNAIKHIFGRSDWQVGVKAFNKIFSSMFIFPDVDQIVEGLKKQAKYQNMSDNDLTKIAEEKIKEAKPKLEKLNSNLAKISEIHLNFLIGLNEAKRSVEELQKEKDQKMGKLIDV